MADAYDPQFVEDYFDTVFADYQQARSLLDQVGPDVPFGNTNLNLVKNAAIGLGRAHAILWEDFRRVVWERRLLRGALRQIAADFPATRQRVRAVLDRVEGGSPDPAFDPSERATKSVD